MQANTAHSSGGGVYIASGSATITNSTLSENVAGGDGGALYSSGKSTLTHVTAVGNSALNTGGIVDAATLLLYNSILADNAGGDCQGALNATLGNLILDLTCSHDGLAEDPDLLLLAGAPAYYLPQPGSPAIDAASADYCLATDQRGIARPPDACDIGAAEYEQGAFSFQIQSALAMLNPPAPGGGSSADVDSEPEATSQPEPALSTCATLPSQITVLGYKNNTACKVLDPGGIGHQTVLDYGFYYAVDIFGDLSSPVTACFRSPSGLTILLDAANSPRNIVPLRGKIENGLICAEVDRAGTVLLMPLEFVNSGLVQDAGWDLYGCSVTTTAIMNLRSEPSVNSAKLANVLNDVQLIADRFANNFYRVNYYNIIGWLSSDYLTKAGSC